MTVLPAPNAGGIKVELISPDILPGTSPMISARSIATCRPALTGDVPTLAIRATWHGIYEQSINPSK